MAGRVVGSAAAGATARAPSSIATTMGTIGRTSRRCGTDDIISRTL
jgi:hypothetical protein